MLRVSRDMYIVLATGGSGSCSDPYLKKHFASLRALRKGGSDRAQHVLLMRRKLVPVLHGWLGCFAKQAFNDHPSAS